MAKRIMNKEIEKYPIYIVQNGKIDKCSFVTSTKDYNHFEYHIHHYIKDYEKNKNWYVLHGIKQKLFLLPIPMHEQVHNRAIKNMDDDQFKNHYGVSRWELLFNRKYSEYGEAVKKDVC